MLQILSACPTVGFHLFRQPVVHGNGRIAIRLDERRERVVVGQRIAAVACQRVTCVLAGEVSDEVRLVLAHESALVGHLVSHGGGDGEERPVGVDVRLHGEGEVHAGDVGVAHQLREEHGLGRGVQRTGECRIALGQGLHVRDGLVGVGPEAAAGFGVLIGNRSRIGVGSGGAFGARRRVAAIRLRFLGRAGCRSYLGTRLVHVSGQVLAEHCQLGGGRFPQLESGVLGEGVAVIVQPAHEGEDAVGHR